LSKEIERTPPVEGDGSKTIGNAAFSSGIF
jgi:hypothetical protein